MKLSYPVTLIPQEKGWLVTFGDIPEALTEGDTIEDAMNQAKDCLIAALGGYINDSRPIPEPSQSDNPQRIVQLPIFVSVKIALYNIILASKCSFSYVDSLLGKDEGYTKKLLDIDNRTGIDIIDEVLLVLGKRIEVNIMDAA